jgi:hypothetical protein
MQWELEVLQILRRQIVAERTEILQRVWDILVTMKNMTRPKRLKL